MQVKTVEIANGLAQSSVWPVPKKVKQKLYDRGDKY